MSRFIIHFACLSVLALGLTGVAAGQDAGDDRDDRERSRMKDTDRGMHGLDEDGLRRLLRDLELTEQQQEQIRKALDEARETRMNWWREHGEAVRELRHAVHEARQADDRERFRENWARLGELMFDAPERGAVVREVNAILTEEQREQLQANWQAARERMKERWRRHHHGDGDRDERGNRRDDKPDENEQ